MDCVNRLASKPSLGFDSSSFPKISNSISMLFDSLTDWEKLHTEGFSNKVSKILPRVLLSGEVKKSLLTVSTFPSDWSFVLKECGVSDGTITAAGANTSIFRPLMRVAIWPEFNQII